VLDDIMKQDIFQSSHNLSFK